MIKKRVSSTFLFFLVFLFFSGDAYPASLKIQCSDCHDSERFKAEFKNSVHGNTGCTSCHKNFESLDKHIISKEKPALISCGTCHSEIEKQYRNSFHSLYEDFKCYDCHHDIHTLKPEKEHFKIAVAKTAQNAIQTMSMLCQVTAQQS